MGATCLENEIQKNAQRKEQKGKTEKSTRYYHGPYLDLGHTHTHTQPSSKSQHCHSLANNDFYAVLNKSVRRSLQWDGILHPSDPSLSCVLAFVRHSICLAIKIVADKLNSNYKLSINQDTVRVYKPYP